jgi:hypothetical protein
VPIWHGKFIEQCRQRKAAALSAKVNGSFFNSCTPSSSMASCAGGGWSSSSGNSSESSFLAAQKRDVSLWVPGAGANLRRITVSHDTLLFFSLFSFPCLSL